MRPPSDARGELETVRPFFFELQTRVETAREIYMKGGKLHMVEEIRMRGRNGTVNFHELRVFVGKEASFVDFFSTRKGKTAPIYFSGDANLLIDLFEDVVRELRQQGKENGW